MNSYVSAKKYNHVLVCDYSIFELHSDGISLMSQEISITIFIYSLIREGEVTFIERCYYSEEYSYWISVQEGIYSVDARSTLP